MVIWDAAAIEAACILSEAGFSAKEAAEAMGISRAALLGKSKRCEQFQFTVVSTGKAPPPEVYAARVVKAKELITNLKISDVPRPKKTRFVVNTTKAFRAKRPNQPPLYTDKQDVEKPLDESEKRMIFHI